MLPLGWTPTRSAIPPKPITRPSSLAPPTRSWRAYLSASRAVKSGADAWITAGKPRVDPRLRPRDRRDRNGRVHEPDQEEGSPGPAGLRDEGPAAEAQERDRQQGERSDPEPGADQRRRLELAHADLDEHERGAPEGRERE